MGVPIYLFTGFIESGKTSLIDETLSDDNFNAGEKTLLLVCEEGEVEYDLQKAKYQNVHIEYIEDLDDLTYEKLSELQNKYTFERVMIEYNGTWKVEDLFRKHLPAQWEFAQMIATVDASTFENYILNMKSLIYEQLRFAELIIFNRCDKSIKKSFLRSNVRAYNRSAQIIYENTDRQLEEMGEDELPFDLSKDEIDIEPDDYGIWYMDALDHPKKYAGKTLSFTGIGYPTKQFGESIIAVGRYAMVCCAQDKAYLGVGVIDKTGDDIEPGSWMKVKGKVRIDYDPESNTDYISIDKSTITPTVPLVDADVIF